MSDSPFFNDREAAFFRALTRPFPKNQVTQKDSGKGGILDYIDAQVVKNRLDEVCGPSGWKAEYRVAGDGVICRLWLRIPDKSPHEDAYDWHWKEGGGGFPAMQGPDAKENGFKGGFSDSLKRAAEEWGVGRHLYKNGVPEWHDEASSSAPAQRPAPQRTQPQGPPQSGPQQRQFPIRFEIPQAARAWGWAKDMETHFKERIIDGMCARGEELGVGRDTRSWDAEATKIIAEGAIEYLKGRPQYKGEFDHLKPQDHPAMTGVTAGPAQVADDDIPF